MPIPLPSHQYGARFVTQPGLGELCSSADIRLLLDGLLDRALADCRASASALFFAIEPALHLRLGEWDPPALDQLEQWEQGIESELRRQPVHLGLPTPPGESRLPAGRLCFLVNAPLLTGTEVIGSLTLAYPSEDYAPNEYASMIHAAASHMGGLARLLHELQLTRYKLTQLELFFRIGQNMVSTLDLSQLLADTTGIATSILNAGAASLMLVDEERQELVFEIAVGEKGEVLKSSRIPINQGIAGWVVTHGAPLIVNDTSRDERFSQQVDARTGFLTRSVIAVPLSIKGKTIGVLEVLNKYCGKGFDQDDQEILMTIAGQAATAIENARLYQALRDERDRIVAAQEEVRRELARNLHDGTVQLLAAIAMNIDHVEKLVRHKPEALESELDSLRQLARQATRHARLLLFELRPVILESRGLLAALHTYVDQLRQSDKFSITFTADEVWRRLIPRVERPIFSIIQEAVNNIRRHAKADQVWIRLMPSPHALHVEIEDDGVGFHLKEVKRSYDERGSFGLLNMKERAELINARLTIESLDEGRAQGTMVRLAVPLDDDMWEELPLG